MAVQERRVDRRPPGALRRVRDANDDRGAARAAARLFHDHFYRGEGAVAVGWLRRGFRHVEGDPDCVESGWLQMAEAELFLHRGPLEQAVAGAAKASPDSPRPP